MIKDKNGLGIKVGDLVKRSGYVEYSDGKRYKTSKKTWQVSKIEDGKLYYKTTQTDWKGVEVEQEEVILQAKGVDFLVVGDEKGIKKEYSPIKEIRITAGSVSEKYKILKDIPKHNWKKGEVVSITGKVSFKTLEEGYLQKVAPDTPHKHVIIVADTAKIKGNINNG